MCDRLKKRVEAAALLEAPVKQASDLLVNRLDRWVERAKRAAEMSKTLVYERTGEDDKYLPLIMMPETPGRRWGSSQAPFVVANSMREVQPDINVLVSPIPERLFARKPEGVPDWVLPVVEES